MAKRYKLLRYHCEDAAEVIIASQDRKLSWHEWLLLRLHLLVCKVCPRLIHQMAFIHRAMAQWSHNDPEVKRDP